MSLNAQTTFNERAAAKAATNEPPPLNLEFPFERLAFDPFFFGLDAEPVELPETG